MFHTVCESTKLCGINTAPQKNKVMNPEFLCLGKTSSSLIAVLQQQQQQQQQQQKKKKKLETMPSPVSRSELR